MSARYSLAYEYGYGHRRGITWYPKYPADYVDDRASVVAGTVARHVRDVKRRANVTPAIDETRDDGTRVVTVSSWRNGFENVIQLTIREVSNDDSTTSFDE